MNMAHRATRQQIELNQARRRTDQYPVVRTRLTLRRIALGFFAGAVICLVLAAAEAL